MSVLSTGAAAAPGLALLFQLATELARERFLHAPGIAVYDYSTTLLSVLWLFVGPMLLAHGFLRARGQKRPPGTIAVQLGHAALWMISSWVGLEFAAGV